MKILESLLMDLKLNPAVVNVLIDYTLKTNNNKLVKSIYRNNRRSMEKGVVSKLLVKLWI
ncbi:MAG: hypothetical protein L6V81_01845 [Clostridium sp.]|nr:MAG: hypothetical protein L6V81_01845 [Clostridium sp.]